MKNDKCTLYDLEYGTTPENDLEYCKKTENQGN
ncbi:hypothetical protein T02_2621 [Trichinella nativa]|uniref:Uncharacterized protein n=1 Tax=Trichinella nativa TaxID=6335 RepID=A0A0V1KHJ3_9BILA|nr:hypothetical protein T02_2621 [Trichinella nativa]